MNGTSLLFFLALIVSISAGAQKKEKTTGNPVFPGWYADPEAVILDSKCWVYPTFSAPYEQQVFLDAFSSSDLKTWKKHARILDTSAVRWAKKAIWAPALVHRDNRYFLFFSANDVHEGETGGIGVAVSHKPEGPFTDLLGKPLIGTIHNGAQPIDQFVFSDDKGQYYMIYGGWGHCNLVRLKSDFTGLLPFDDSTIFREITPKGYVEGPILFNRKGKYYFMWSEGGWGGPDYRVAYAVSDSLTGPFQRRGTILQQDQSVATGAGHHSVVPLPGTDTWYIVYHRRPLGETDRNHRVVCIDRMEFDAEGNIRPVKITFEGPGRVRIKKSK